MTLRWIERSEERNRFLASCWVRVEPPWTTSLAWMFGQQGARRAEDVDAEVLEEAAVLGGERGLDHVIGDVLERDGIVVQDAALADLAAGLVEEGHAVAAGEEAAFVELEERGQGEPIEHDEAAGAERQRLGGAFVEQAAPAGQAEARKEARGAVPGVADARADVGERGIDLGIELEPVDDPSTAALPEEPVAHVSDVLSGVLFEARRGNLGGGTPERQNRIARAMACV